MAKRQIHLTNEEIRAFERAGGHTRDAYELRHLQTVRLYGSSVPTQEIRHLVQCSDRRMRE